MSNPSDSDLATARELLRVYGLRGHSDADGSDWIAGIAAALRAEREAVWREVLAIVERHDARFLALMAGQPGGIKQALRDVVTAASTATAEPERDG